MIYVANSTSNTVSVINGYTDKAVTNITVGNQPLAIGVDPVKNMIYVANFASDTVSVIDGTRNTVVNSIQLPAGSNPYYIAINPSTNIIYVNSRLTTYLIDGYTNIVRNIKESHGNCGDCISGIAVSTEVDKSGHLTQGAYIVNFTKPEVCDASGICGQKGEIYKLGYYMANEFKVNVGPAFIPPFAVAFDAYAGKIFVASDAFADVYVIDSLTNKVTDTIHLGEILGQGINRLGSISVNTKTRMLYVDAAANNSTRYILAQYFNVIR
jgi:YVTN family beta-propeller protein